jgi:hypothetical protein
MILGGQVVLPDQPEEAEADNECRKTQIRCFRKHHYDNTLIIHMKNREYA